MPKNAGTFSELQEKNSCPTEPFLIDHKILLALWVPATDSMILGHYPKGYVRIYLYLQTWKGVISDYKKTDYESFNWHASRPFGKNWPIGSRTKDWSYKIGMLNFARLRSGNGWKCWRGIAAQGRKVGARSRKIEKEKAVKCTDCESIHNTAISTWKVKPFLILPIQRGLSTVRPQRRRSARKGSYDKFTDFRQSRIRESSHCRHCGEILQNSPPVCRKPTIWPLHEKNQTPAPTPGGFRSDYANFGKRRDSR